MLNPQARFQTIVKTLEVEIMSAGVLQSLVRWTKMLSQIGVSTFQETHDSYTAHPDAKLFIITASKRIYDFVRSKLAVPFLRTQDVGGEASTGHHISVIHGAIRTGTLYVPTLACLMDVALEDTSPLLPGDSKL